MPVRSDESLEKGLAVKIFAGFVLNSELRMQLSQSDRWKHANLGSLATPGDLKEVPHKGKSYIGAYCQQIEQTLPELWQQEAALRQKLREYCPEFDADNVHLYVFPQVFIS